MKEPVFSQLERLAEYDDGVFRTPKRRRPRRDLDALLREDGRVLVEDDADAE